jgi:preprotein translocase subunit SecF
MNECLSRTLLTSFTALMSVVALLIFGGGAINDFALMLFIGMISGVYSTVYIAAPVAMLWHPEKKLGVVKQG